MKFACKTKNSKLCLLSDTVFLPSIVPLIEGADVLYHETTYLNNMEKEAELRQHATAGQAAEIARRAGVGLLITVTIHPDTKTWMIFRLNVCCISEYPAGLEGNIYSIGSVSMPTLDT